MKFLKKESEKKMNNIILLDIDGVIAPIYSLNTDDYVEINADYANWQIPFINMYNVKKITETGEIIWASVWEEQSNLINEFLEIPHFEHIKFAENYDEWFKERAVKETIEQHKNISKIVWVDDEIPEHIVEEYMNEENILIIIPNGETGITLEEWKRISHFLENGKV